MEGVTIRPIQLNFSPDRTELEDFLRGHHLKLETDVEQAFGLYDYEGRLLGCGCAA